MAYYTYDQRMQFYPELIELADKLGKDGQSLAKAENIMIQFIKSMETEKISRRFQEEIIPEVMKLRPRLQDKFDLDNIMPGEFNEDKNPDWDSFFKDSPDIYRKLEEMSKLQVEGSVLPVRAHAPARRRLAHDLDAGRAAVRIEIEHESRGFFAANHHVRANHVPSGARDERVEVLENERLDRRGEILEPDTKRAQLEVEVRSSLRYRTSHVPPLPTGRHVSQSRSSVEHPVPGTSDMMPRRLTAVSPPARLRVGGGPR